jgi:tripartite-type tricarboxylate transporter receptor subunit TctC
MNTAKRRAFLGGAAALAALPLSARAQAAPTRILVGSSPGGGQDMVARMIAEKLNGGPIGTVFVENKPGASGMIAADLLTKAPADGSTLMSATQTAYTVAPQLYKNLGFDAQRDVTGVAMLGFNPFVLVVHPSFEARTLQELLDLARAKPATLNYGSGGVGSAPHMVVELLQLNAGIKLVHVPYRGEAPAVADVLAQQIALSFNNVAVVAGHVKSGALRALSVTSPKRLELLPDVPTMAEAGVPDVEVETWFALTAPKATPRDIVRRLNAEVVKALAMPDLAKRYDELAIRPAGGSPDIVDAMIKSEVARWSEVIRRADIKLATY